MGIFGATAGLHLRQTHELVSHFFSSKASEQIDKLTALNIIKNSVKYVLGQQQIELTITFTKFREKLLRENLRPNDAEFEMLVNSPIFYSRTAIFILLNSISKEDEGAKVEHGLANLNLILPQIWEKLADQDRFSVGFAYRDVVAANNTMAANGLKQALMKVAGFDYVPESLRSNTFIKAAQHLLEVHYAMNNFYNEPAAVSALASLGSTIPKPAFLKCIQAYLLVCIGNFYGVSTAAAKIAKSQLEEIPEDRWKYYFEKGFTDDQEVLYNLQSSDQIRRFHQLLQELELTDFKNLPRDNQRLYNAVIKNQSSVVTSLASDLYRKTKT